MPRSFRKNGRTYARVKKRTYRRKRSAQSKFKLARPRRKVVNQLTNILETKKFLGLDYKIADSTWIQNPIEVGTLPLTSAGLSFMPDSFYRHQFQSKISDQLLSTNKELENNCIEGSSIFSKYLQVKVQLDYPDGSGAPLESPRPVEIIWGWVNPLNFTEFTTPKIDEVTPQQIRDHTLDAIANEFNSSTDPMEFHDRHKRRYNIIGRKKCLPNLTKQIPTKDSVQFGPHNCASAKLNYSLNFKMMKKVNYTNSQAIGDVNVPQFAYPNEAYLPFVYLYNPDFAMYDVSGVDPIEFKFNDAHWFNDA